LFFFFSTVIYFYFSLYFSFGPVLSLIVSLDLILVLILWGLPINILTVKSGHLHGILKNIFINISS